VKGGRLSDRLVFEKRTLTLNAAGQTTITWTTGFTVWGEAQRQSEQNCRFIIRYKSGIGPDTYRILFFNAIWTITSAVPDHKKTMLTIESDFSALIEATHMLSTKKEFIDGLPTVRPS